MPSDFIAHRQNEHEGAVVTSLKAYTQYHIYEEFIAKIQLKFSSQS
jgi:hypothetical protein